MITINPSAADVITININDADQIQLNTTAILLEDRDAATLEGEDGAYYLSRANHTGSQAANTITGLAVVATSGSYNDLSNRPTISTDAATLQGQNGAYYLSRANHTGTQAISTVAGLQTALDAKLNTVDYNDRFLGLYASIMELETAHPTANAGDYAQVDWGIGTDVIVYVYDVDDTQWIPVGSSPIANTDALPEGSTNLYFTGQRVRDTPLTGLSTATATPITSTDSVLSGFGKLQAQINAGGGSGGNFANAFYLAGVEYNQDLGSSSGVGGTTATATTNTMTLYPFRVVEDVAIDRYSFVVGNQGTIDQSKFALYEAVVSGGGYALTRVTEQALVDTSQANTKYNVTASATLRAGKLYFFGIISNSLRNYLAVPLANAPSLGYATSGVSVLKTTALRSAAFPISSNHPSTLNTSGFTAVTTVPIEFRIRVAS